MSDDSGFGFGDTERTEVDGLIKVTDVVGLDIGKAQIPHQMDDVDQETHTVWVDVGDTYSKTDPDLGEFEITVLTIYRVEENDRENWYEVEIEHQPIIDEDADNDVTRTPLVKKQSVRSFAQEAVNLEPIDDAGLAPEERDGDGTVQETV